MACLSAGGFVCLVLLDLSGAVLGSDDFFAFRLLGAWEASVIVFFDEV